MFCLVGRTRRVIKVLPERERVTVCKVTTTAVRCEPAPSWAPPAAAHMVSQRRAACPSARRAPNTGRTAAAGALVHQRCPCLGGAARESPLPGETQALAGLEGDLSPCSGGHTGRSDLEGSPSPPFHPKRQGGRESGSTGVLTRPNSIQGERPRPGNPAGDAPSSRGPGPSATGHPTRPLTAAP